MKHMRIVSIMVSMLFVLSLEAAGPIKVKLDLEPHNDWTVNPLLFGSYNEEHWGDIIPGIYEQYVVNPSFEQWYVKKQGDREPQEKSNIIWPDIPKVDGLAFPWEKIVRAGSPVVELTEDALNTELAQRVTVTEGDIAYLYQRLALPFYRVKSFNVSFYAKSSGRVNLKVFMTTKNPENRLAEKEITVLSDKWQKCELTFHIDRQREQHIKRYGVYNLGFEVSGEGCVDFDLVTLFPTDCHDGVFNPETIAHFRNYGPTMMRWPGGNFTSAYRWQDGIGRFEDRRSLPNLAWGGLCTNHVGLDEFLRFCELTDIVPVMGVGYNRELISPEDIADWVEYCNGDLTTPMGKLRAENGHPEPYDVKYWGIGNEVYGKYQQGHEPDPEAYAAGLVEIVKEIRKVDPSVEIIASGYGAHNRFRATSDWNEKLIRRAGAYIDYIDIHSYVYGPSRRQMEGVEKVDIYRTFAAANYALRTYIDDMRTLLKKEGMEHIKMCLLEWSVQPKHGFPYIHSFANLMCTSAYLNEFLRNADFLQMGAHHNFSIYVQPVRGHAYRVNPRTLLYRHYGLMAGGKILDIDVEGMPVYDVDTNWENIGPSKNVHEVDMMAVRKGNRVYVTLVNRDNDTPYEIKFDFSAGKIRKFKGSTYTSEKPFDQLLWQNVNEVKGHVKNDVKATVISDTEASLNIPAFSYTLLTIDLQQ